MKRGVLVEIGTEEIPARFMPQALVDLQECLLKEMQASRIECSDVRTVGTPRRLALTARLEETQWPEECERLGPPKSVAFDGEGRPTKAAMGFAKREGVGVGDLILVDTPKGSYVAVCKREEGRRAQDVMSEILPRIISSIAFPKSMRWGESDLRFARPIHWIVALFGEELIPFQVGDITSGLVTKGHRFHHPGELNIDGFDDYVDALRGAFVIVDPVERKELIRSEIARVTQEIGGVCLEDEELLEEVTFLVEYPVAVLGRFDVEYLALPREVLITAMQHHQKYFPVVDGDGCVINYFVAVSNTKADDMSAIREGNERVLRARLADARFFFEEDQKVALERRVEELKDVIFQTKLGSSYEKVGRVQELSVWLAEQIGCDDVETVSRAAYLCKADLVTGMVGEFPQLQGIMGREYALRAGEPRPVADVIYEHYLPRFTGDELPHTMAGDVVSIADKLDTIAGYFGVGLPPTGTSDPFALRRQALGIINIILGKAYRLDLGVMIDKSLCLLGEKLGPLSEEKKRAVMAFFQTRVANLLVSRGYAGDLVEATIAVRSTDLVDLQARIEALTAFRLQPEFEPLTVAFKRVGNILKDVAVGVGPDPTMFESSMEKELHQRYLDLKERIAALMDAGDYQDALHGLATLRTPVDAFFDHVLVMAPETSLRTNRLALLGEIYGLFSRVADFTHIVTEVSESADYTRQRR